MARPIDDHGSRSWRLLAAVFAVSLGIGCQGGTAPETEAVTSAITTTQKDSFFSDANRWNVAAAYSTIQYPDVNNDYHTDVCGRRDDGIWCAVDDATGTGTLINPSQWSTFFADNRGWNAAQYYSTIKFPDLNGDNKADICGRGPDVLNKPASGVWCALSSGAGFGAPTLWNSSFSDGNGWTAPQYNSTIQFPDLDGNGSADICARGIAGIICALNTGSDFGGGGSPPTWSNFYSDANGWGLPQYYSTIRFPDLNGDGYPDVCGRGPDASGNVRLWCGLSDGATGFSAPTAWDGALGDPTFDDVQYYSTIKFADINGDGYDDICARGPGAGPGSRIGIWCGLSDGAQQFSSLQLWDATQTIGNQTWNLPSYYSTIRLGKGVVCGRGVNGIYCAYSNGTSFKYLDLESSNESDAHGWGNAQYYSTIGVTRDDKLVARGSAGIWEAPLARDKPDEITIGPTGKNMNYYKCAIDGGTCSVGASALYMAYGANGSFVYKLLGGNVSCGVSTFGSDPAPGVVKGCYFSNYGTNGTIPSTGVLENHTATADGNVAFGANGAFFFKTVHGSFTCNTATFGDPLQGVSKVCYLGAPTYTRVAGDGQTMTGVFNTPLAYGAAGRFVYSVPADATHDPFSYTYPCSVGVPVGFPYDPAPGVVKDCYRLTDGHRGTPTAQLMANDDQTWTSKTSQTINTFYGSGRNGNFILTSTNASSGACNAQFGDPDPAVPKRCWNAPIPGPFQGTWTKIPTDVPDTTPPFNCPVSDQCPSGCTVLTPNGVESAIAMPDGSVMVNTINQFTHWYRLTAGPSGGFTNGTWTRLPDSLWGRHAYPATPLRDGRLLVCGGEDIGDQNGCPVAGNNNHCEIFDPNSGANGTWTQTTDYPLAGQIVDGVMAPLPNGKILVGGAYVTQSLEFDPTQAFGAGAWSMTGETAHEPTESQDNRPFCEGSFAQLQTGDILLAEIGYSLYHQLNPTGMRWSAAMNPPAQEPFGAFGCGGDTGEGASALTLYDGRALSLGAFGNNAIVDPTGSNNPFNVKQTPQEFPDALNIGNMGSAHEAGQTVTPTGRVLIAAHSSKGFHKFVEYDATADEFFDVSFGASPLVTETNYTNGGMISQTLLPDGSVLVASPHEKSVYVYRPAGGQLTTFGRPTLTAITGPVNGVYTLTGTTLNGLTNGANRDDEGSSYTSFPVVSVTSGSTTRYAIVTSVSTTSIAPGTSATVKFKAPRAGWPGHGTLTVRVSASGLASSNSKTITVP